MFKQDIKNGWQVETPDYWLQKVSPWEIRRNDINYPIRFGGEVRTIVDSSSGFVRVRITILVQFIALISFVVYLGRWRIDHCTSLRRASSRL